VCNEDRRTYERPGFPSEHANAAGLYDARRPGVRDADVVLFLGCRCFHEFEPSAGPEMPPGARVVHTHTDPGEIGAIHGVDVDLVGDERLVLAALLNALPPSGGGAGARVAEPGWLAAARADHGHTAGGPPRDATAAGPGPAVTAVDPGLGGGALATVADVVAELAVAVGPGTTVVGDATTSGAMLLHGLPQKPPHQLYTSCSGSLGWGMGAAIGISLALPDREVIAVEGDGAFQFGPQALWVAARQRLPVIFLVINNQSYAAVAAALRRYGGRAARRGEYPGKDVGGMDVARIARGYGVAAERLASAKEIGPAIERARAHPGPSLIEVMTDPADLGP
jgi:benzoylformate decarboxylase